MVSESDILPPEYKKNDTTNLSINGQENNQHIKGILTMKDKKTPEAPDVRLVLIEWIDSVQPVSNWVYLSDYKPHQPIKCVSVGYLIHDGKDVKALAPNMGETGSEINIQAAGIIHIPSCSILKISDLIVKEVA